VIFAAMPMNLRAVGGASGSVDAATSPIPMLPPVMSTIFPARLLTAFLLYFQSFRVLS
jgi:hypothetical protein